MEAGSANVTLFVVNKKVDLSNKNLSNEEIVEIAEALKNKECVVQTLDITLNLIGDNGAESIARALQSNTSLQTLKIGCA